MSIEPIAAPRRGLPAWVLSAVLPLMLSLGFVAGMGAAHVRLQQASTPPARDPVTRPDPSGGAVAGTPSNNSPTPPLGPGTLSPARVQPNPGPSSPTGQVTPPVNTGGGGRTPTADGPMAGDTTPSNVYGNTPAPTTIRTIQEARLALVNDQAGNSPLEHIDYQQMRNADGSVSLVGILNAEQYMTWESVLRRDSQSLQRWLQLSANLVMSAAQTDRFGLSWALVETRVSVPTWALPSEVTALTDGRFLIVRYVAGASTDHPQVDLRPLSTLGAPADPTATWSRYGPQLRFDGTDIYRPTGTTDAAPKKP